MVAQIHNALRRRLMFGACFLALSALSGCGGSGGGSNGGGGNEPPPPPRPPPGSSVEVSVAPSSIDESNTGTADLVFEISLDAADTADVTVDYATSDGTAREGEDYSAANGTLTIPAGDTTASVTVTVEGDTEIEPDETLTLTLSNVSSNAILGTASATGTIRNEDMPAGTEAGFGLNDTGVTRCANELAIDLDCDDAAAGTGEYPRQDAQFGRDVNNNDDADGRAGFELTKLDANGEPLDDQSGTYASAPWQCVRDEVTGLTWEVKTDDDGFHDRDAPHFWYDGASNRSRLVGGYESARDCTHAEVCNTEQFVEAANATELCGFSDWRLPTRSELLSIVDYGAAAAPYIDTARFPNAVGGYWSASADLLGRALVVDFTTGQSIEGDWSDLYGVRVVRGGAIR